jgi:hypothetical protein
MRMLYYQPFGPYPLFAGLIALSTLCLSTPRRSDAPRASTANVALQLREHLFATSRMRNTPARIADCGWVRNAVLTGAKPNESVVADRRMLGEERWSSAARAVGATPRVAPFRGS